MLQRSPTYIAILPDADPMANLLRAALPAGIAYRAIRGRNLLLSTAFYQFCRRFPEAASRFLRREVAKHLPPGYPIDRHFTPRYNPWDQRLCLVPDADLFKAISAGTASVVTDTIDELTETGIRLRSGELLEADIIVTATGLRLVPYGGIALSVDGKPVQVGDALVYKGMMLSDVPNMAWCVGYTNASWTLRADLSSRHVCRLLNFMDRNGYDQALPSPGLADPADPGAVVRRPLLGLSSGYVARAVDELPKQGSKAPWFLRQNYLLELVAMELARVDDPSLAFSRRAISTPTLRRWPNARVPAHARSPTPTRRRARRSSTRRPRRSD
jgi:cation diffusion facilitator CzcD-associated flavoprotein CzcO